MSRWWYRPKGTAVDPRLRLFCFPYAGGWPGVFRPWAARLPADVELVAVRMPGRESRFAEQPYTDWFTLTNDVAAALGPLLDVPFVLFGHSFGGMLAYEMARIYNGDGRPHPQVLIVSAAAAPSYGRSSERHTTLRATRCGRGSEKSTAHRPKSWAIRNCER